MQNRYEFYKSLQVGDVITSRGVKPASGKKLSKNGLHNQGWDEYARVTSIVSKELLAESPLKSGDQIGIRVEGIQPSLHDCFVHVANSADRDAPKERKATKPERTAFMKQYVKTRTEIVDHNVDEIANQMKKMKAERKRLQTLAKAEKIDVAKLLKKGKK